MTIRYRCSACGGEFTSEAPEEEAFQEAAFIGFTDRSSLVPICDPCHRDLITVSQKLGFMDEFGRLTEAGATLELILRRNEQGETT